MRTVELFSGTQSFSKVAKGVGYSTFTVDNSLEFWPDLCADILTMLPESLPKRPVDVLWASPPCQAFSVASIGRNWTGGFRAYEPKTDKARLGMALVQKTFDLIRAVKPRYWFIENPRGILRKMPFMETFLTEQGGVRHTVSYCQYGDTRMKPTDIWTNCLSWKPRPMCKNGDKCHESAPRGSKTGTQGLKGAMSRGVIPPELFKEIFKSVK